ncbi:MAG: leucine-rich repeat domain-containing protein [Clostridia bacterium]|nr:leucine-rich repeat domain-containing protein [Clostridia bacterium]
MSSYNRIEKFKHSKNPSDVVALKEYILFTDDHAEEKCVMFKFYNTLNQPLSSIKFEVRQLDGNGEILESSTVVYENCNAEANGYFVPNAKLKLSYECVSIAVKLEEAHFDRVKWVKGEFEDNSYKFENYAGSAGSPAAVREAVRAAAKANAEKEAEHAKKKKRVVFSSENVARKNFAVFPAVWCVIVCILVIAFTIASALIFKQQSSVIYIDGYDLRVSGETAAICGYDGGEEKVTVPKRIGDYTVTKLADGAFKGTRVKEVVITVADDARYTIESGAFENCSKLEFVTCVGEGGITVLGDAFKSCPSLARIALPNAQLNSMSLRGCTNLRTLEFDRLIDERKTLSDLFGANAEKVNLTRMTFAPNSISTDFFKDVKVESVVILNQNCSYAQGWNNDFDASKVTIGNKG